MSAKEPILAPNDNRFVIFPIQHDDLWEWYKKQQACFWTAEEIDLHQDLNDWALLPQAHLSILRGFRWYRERKFSRKLC